MPKNTQRQAPLRPASEQYQSNPHAFEGTTTNQTDYDRKAVERAKSFRFPLPFPSSTSHQIP